MAGVPISLIGVNAGAAGFQGWPTKQAAATALAALRDMGRNVERCIEFHRAYNRFFRFWVIGRPDPLSEFTWLMRRDGSWSRGRLFDAPPTGGGALWQPQLTPEPIPATVTHDYRYSSGWQEVIDASRTGVDLLGRPVLPRLAWWAQVWCVACTWSVENDDEGSVRAAARAHRVNPGNLPLRSDVGRLLSGQRSELVRHG